MSPPSANDHLAWFHLIFTTYGAWLDGDERGFRTRHHREHVDGDYKNPPPEARYLERAWRSRESLKQAPVALNAEYKAIVGAALRDRLVEQGGLVMCSAVASQHAHLLVKIPFDAERLGSGAAKRHAWFVAREHGWQGKLWAKRGKAVRIRNREHQLNCYYYILDHAKVGAWVWRRPSGD